MRDPVIIIPSPVEPVDFDATALTIKVAFPIILVWAVAVLTYCLFANGWM